MRKLLQPLYLEGIVVHGKQLGRRIGFPTANLEVDSMKGSLPETGVYGGECLLPDGRIFATMVNVGYRPTVDQQTHRLSVEAHLLDFDGDLYGQLLKLSITDRIRDERKMATLDELKHQLSLDLEEIRNNR